MGSPSHSTAPVSRSPERQPALIGESPPVRQLRVLIEGIADRTSTVVIHGESGTGKELIARHIHATSARSGGPFVPVDCTTLSDTLFESQLFGHVKGAFTGAERATLGFFRAADGGTLFLDEIGELALPVQAKLLRCIQDLVVVPLGGVEPIAVNVRIVAATHRDLKEMVQRGEFREDLYFRLNVLRLTVAPLRARRSDIALLAEHFLDYFARIYDEPARRLSPGALAALEAYDWPGNVRELANAIEQAHVLSRHECVTVADLPEDLRLAASEPTTPGESQIPTLETAERLLIARALRATDGNQARAAQLLLIDRRRIYRKVRRHGLQALVKRRHS